MNTGTDSMHVRRSWKAMLREDDGGAEALAFARCWNTPMGEVGAPVAVHPRALGGTPLLVRPGTTDAQVLDDTFVGLYHTPLAPLRDDAVILDLGGNVGYTAAHYAALCPRGRVVCVEMDAQNAALASRNLAPFGERCIVVHAAAWVEDGELTYGGTEEWGFRVSGLEGETTTPAGEVVRRVRAMRVETILRECGLDGECIDFAKIDVEGAEDRIVCAGALWLNAVQTVALEFHPPATRETMAAALSAAGFAVRDDARHPRALIGAR